MNTIYHCFKRAKNGHLVLVHKAETEIKAIEYLEENGGGVYRNILAGWGSVDVFEMNTEYIADTINKLMRLTDVSNYDIVDALCGVCFDEEYANKLKNYISLNHE